MRYQKVSPNKNSGKKRINKLIRVLTSLYPNQSGLNFSNNYQLFVAVLLSAQCTDKKVNEVTPDFFNRYPSFNELASAKPREVEKFIRQVNFYKTKAKNLILSARVILETFGGHLPIHDRDALTSLPGCGEKSASVIQACNNIPAFPVDTHVKRVSARLGLTFNKHPEKIAEDLKKIIPKKFWISMHHALIWHGRKICKAVRPLCEQCAVRNLCPTAKA